MFNTAQRDSRNQVTQHLLLVVLLYFRLHTIGELIVCDIATLEKTFERTLTQQESEEKTI